MRTIGKCLLTVLLLGLVVPSFAQNKIFIGKASEIVRTIKSKSNDNRSNNVRSSNEIFFQKIPGNARLLLVLKSMVKEGAAEVYTGSVNSFVNSSFFIKVTGSLLTGNIILKDEKKAYQYSSSNDSAYIEEKDINKIICIDYEKKLSQKQTKKENFSAKVAVPNLQSLPGASAVVLLDFDGENVVSPYWNSGQLIEAEPAMLTFDEMKEVWQLVSEDFRPFDLNITTSESVYMNAPLDKRMRVIFTPTTDFFPGYGGVAYIGSFTWGSDVPCWVFNAGAKYAGEAGSHEIGHTVGLWHDGRISSFEEYYYGNGYWAPIMGVGYYANLVQWSKGEYADATNQEDDINIIASRNGFGFRNDDYSNTAANATPLVFGKDSTIKASNNNGIISTPKDVDVFSFSTTGGKLTVSVNPAPLYPNLDILLKLKNSKEETVAVSDPYSLSVDIDTFLAAGKYYLYVIGTKGKFGPDSDYGSLGEYSISGRISSGNILPTITVTSPVSGTRALICEPIIVTASASDADGTVVQVSFFANGELIGTDTDPANGWSLKWTNLTAGNFAIVTEAIDNNGGRNSSSPVNIIIKADVQPPVITLVNSSTTIWPPNHKLYTIKVSDIIKRVIDDCNDNSTVSIKQVTCDEKPGNGGGNTDKDIFISSNRQEVQVRAERSGSGDGRVYTILLQAVDDHKNIGFATYKVLIPHNPKTPAVAGTIAYTITGNDNYSSALQQQKLVASNFSSSFFQVFPNPVNGNELNIEMYSKTSEQLDISLINTYGKSIFQAKERLVKGTNRFRLPVGGISSGLYVLVIQNGKERITQKVVISKY